MAGAPFYVCRVLTTDGGISWVPEEKAVTATSAEAALDAWGADGTVPPGPVLAIPVAQVTRATMQAGPLKVRLS